MSNLIDIIEDGKYISQAWADEDGHLYITFPFCTLWIPNESIGDFIDDLKQLATNLEAYSLLNG